MISISQLLELYMYIISNIVYHGWDIYDGDAEWLAVFLAMHWDLLTINFYQYPTFRHFYRLPLEINEQRDAEKDTVASIRAVMVIIYSWKSLKFDDRSSLFSVGITFRKGKTKKSMVCEWFGHGRSYSTEAFLINYHIINDKYYIFVIQMQYLWL